MLLRNFDWFSHPTGQNYNKIFYIFNSFHIHFLTERAFYKTLKCNFFILYFFKNMSSKKS